MAERRPLTHEQFKRVVRRVLFEKPKQGAVSDDYEPTPEELEQVYRVESVPSDKESP